MIFVVQLMSRHSIISRGTQGFQLCGNIFGEGPLLFKHFMHRMRSVKNWFPQPESCPSGWFVPRILNLACVLMWMDVAAVPYHIGAHEFWIRSAVITYGRNLRGIGLNSYSEPRVLSKTEKWHRTTWTPASTQSWALSHFTLPSFMVRTHRQVSSSRRPANQDCMLNRFECAVQVTKIYFIKYNEVLQRGRWLFSLSLKGDIESHFWFI